MDRLILAEITLPWVFGVLMFTSLFFAGGDFLRIAQYLGQGESPALVGRLFVTSLPYIIAITLPMATLLAALLGFGRLSNDSEITALIAAGTSFERIMAPVGLFALLVSLVGFWFTNAVVPAANKEREAIIDRVKTQGAGVLVPSGFTYQIRKDGKLQTQVTAEGGIDLRDRSLRNVSVEQWSGGVMISLVYAKRAEWDVNTQNWRLYDGWFAGRSGEDTISGRLSDGRTIENVPGPAALSTLSGRVKDLSTPALQARLNTLRRGGQGSSGPAREADVEIAQRVANPFAAFVFGLVGAPLGISRQRTGKGVGFGLAILIIFAYYVAFQFLSFLAQVGALPALLALSLPNLVGLAAAALLIRRVLR